MFTRRDFLLAPAGAGAALLARRAAGNLLDLAGRVPSPPENRRASDCWRASRGWRAIHVLNRLGYGPRPGDVERVRSLGIHPYVEEQLSPQSIADWPSRFAVRRIEIASLSAPDLFDYPASEVLTELRRATLLRALFSERQLLEVMVEFWSDHFNIDAAKGDCAWLKVGDDRDVIRKHAMGSFRDLLRASLGSPAMLVYLDGISSTKQKPNENHARELLELHTLGVRGGYGQADVEEVARALTGWRLRRFFSRGERVVDAASHDPGEKTVLGVRLTGSPEDNLDQLAERLASHPATADFIALKLCRRFHGPGAPSSLQSRVSLAFRNSKGNIRQTLGALLFSEEFLTAPPKLKRPYTFVLSVLRGLGASSDGGPGLQRELDMLGHIPFGWPTPDGPPEDDSRWSGGFLGRWNFAFRLFSSGIRGTRIPRHLGAERPAQVLQTLVQRPITPAEEAALEEAGDSGRALALCHPEFQRQ
ncbi:MAG: hypothetical protein DIJKHBIC_01149 [Thermoanaerobaculia bacterium]|nr:hypothetical protein [Thermoanaerobaculia bacterium]